MVRSLGSLWLVACVCLLTAGLAYAELEVLVPSDGIQILSPTAPDEQRQTLDNLRFNFDLRNNSTSEVGGFWVEVFPSKSGGMSLLRTGTPLTASTRFVDNLSPGETRRIVFNNPFLNITDGLYTPVLMINRDSTGGPAESTRDNNIYRMKDRVLLLKQSARVADLTFLNEPSFSFNGSNVNVTCTVVNNGTGDSPPFWTEVIQGGRSAEDILTIQRVFPGLRIDTLAPGQWRTLSFSVQMEPEPTGQSVAVMVDSTNIVPETNEANNYRYGTTNPGNPGTIDLEILDVAILSPLAPNTVRPGDIIRYQITVRNNSATNSGDVWFEVFPSETGGLSTLRTGTPICDSVRQNVPAGQTVTFTNIEVPYLSVTPGLYTPVFMVNRLGTNPEVLDPTPGQNSFAYAEGSILLTNSEALQPNLLWSAPPSIIVYGLQARIVGELWNASSAHTTPFWIEMSHGGVDADDIYYLDEFLISQRVETLAPNETLFIDKTFTMPTNTEDNFRIAVAADATDIVYESNETDNFHLLSAPVNVYFEDFNDGLAQGWSEYFDEQWTLTGGEFVANGLAVNTGWMTANYNTQSWADCSAQVQVRRAGYRSTVTGLAVRTTHDFLASERGSAYAAGISFSGSFWVIKYIDGNHTFLTGWTSAPNIDPDGTNTLTLSVVGQKIYFYINGKLTWSGTDSSITEPGRVALFAYEGGSEAVNYFDNVSVATQQSAINAVALDSIPREPTIGLEETVITGFDGEAPNEEPVDVRELFKLRESGSPQ